MRITARHGTVHGKGAKQLRFDVVCEGCGTAKSVTRKQLAKAKSCGGPICKRYRGAGRCAHGATSRRTCGICAGDRSGRAPSRSEYRARGIRAYGGACACCGEREPGFLQLDHVHNDGAAERRRTNRSAWAIAHAEGWPDRYQLLCANCNMAKELYGVCPHRRGELLVGGLPT